MLSFVRQDSVPTEFLLHALRTAEGGGRGEEVALPLLKFCLPTIFRQFPLVRERCECVYCELALLPSSPKHFLIFPVYAKFY